MRVILDAWGTDEAPLPEIEGAISALAESNGLSVTLVGDARVISERLKGVPEGLEIVDAPERVGAHEKPTDALRYKKESSLGIGLRLLSESKGDAFLSAGNTGAVMAFSLMTLKTLEGVKRPGIAAFFPRRGGGYCLVIDVGANLDVKPVQLEQFAIMGVLAHKHLFGTENPKVGILNIGEESVKGNALVLATQRLLAESGLNFIGFVEGHELLTQKADVVVMDGFVGNVILKFGEGLASAVFGFLKEEMRGKPETYLGAMLMRRAIKGLLRKVDFEEYGGAPLLGVNGLVMICHGRSGPRAIKNAILTLRRLHEGGLLTEIKREIALHTRGGE
ncbi:MAG: phosphate acyltransferase PlsX [candidate division WOR-3 bacterium]